MKKFSWILSYSLNWNKLLSLPVPIQKGTQVYKLYSKSKGLSNIYEGTYPHWPARIQ